MLIEHIRAITGPNVHYHEPVLVMRLDLEDLTERESNEFPGFVERLLALLPGLRTHTCGLGYEGGFVERLNGGTYFGHIVEHVAIELSEPAGIGVNHGKTRSAGPPHLYNVVVRYRSEEGMAHLLRSAVDLVTAVLRDEPYDVAALIAETKGIISRTQLGPSTRSIVEAAERRGIPWERLSDGSLLQLGWGARRRLVQAAMADSTSGVAVEVVSDKALTKDLLERASIPVPRGVLVETEDEAARALADVRGPVAVKPLDARQGQGITLGVRTEAEMRAAFAVAAAYARDVIVEEQMSGCDYRVLVIGGRMVAAAQRCPASVTGDGARTVAELIEAANQDPRRGDGHDNALTRIEVDEVVLARLARDGLTLESVPGVGVTVYLRDTANLSTGGTAADVTDRVHPSVRAMCERAARVVGLDICGIDLVTEEIAQPISDRGGIIELNAAPGLRMHLAPSEGTPRDVGAAIVDMLFPPGADGRIPVVATTGTNGKTTVTRMVAHVLARTGRTVGMTTTDGIHIGGHCIAEGDSAGPASARAVLADPAVEVAVLETARGGMQRAGLAYDWSDVGIVTNIQPDHIGVGGIRDLDDLVQIKSLVAERVRAGGTLVLNADDERAAALVERRYVKRVPKTIAFFSMEPDSPRIAAHRAAGGLAYIHRDGRLIEACGEDERTVLPGASIPATMGGAAAYNIANALAATAACRALGLSLPAIAEALATFGGDGENPGRSNIMSLDGGLVVVDYGHNPHALAALAGMASGLRRRASLIFTVPGDRADHLIEESGWVVARGFDRIFIREDEHPRGRRTGEVAGILRRAIQETVPGREVSYVPDHLEALRRAVRRMTPHDVVVHVYEEAEQYRDAMALLRELGAQPADPASLSYSPVPIPAEETRHDTREAAVIVQ